MGSNPTTSSFHRLQHGLPGYLILFAPHAFAPQRQSQPSKPSSPPVFFHISTHFTATRGIPSVEVKFVDIGKNTGGEGGDLVRN